MVERHKFNTDRIGVRIESMLLKRTSHSIAAEAAKKIAEKKRLKIVL